MEVYFPTPPASSAISVELLSVLVSSSGSRHNLPARVSSSFCLAALRTSCGTPGSTGGVSWTACSPPPSGWGVLSTIGAPVLSGVDSTVDCTSPSTGCAVSSTTGSLDSLCEGLSSTCWTSVTSGAGISNCVKLPSPRGEPTTVKGGRPVCVQSDPSIVSKFQSPNTL